MPDTGIKVGVVSKQTIRFSRGRFPNGLFVVRVWDLRGIGEIFGGLTWVGSLWRLINNAWVSIGPGDDFPPGVYYIPVDTLDAEQTLVLEGIEDIGFLLSPDLISQLHAYILACFWNTDTGGMQQGDGSVSSYANVPKLVRAITDIVRADGSGDLAAILTKVLTIPDGVASEAGVETAIGLAHGVTDGKVDGANSSLATVLSRLSSTRAGYLDYLPNVNNAQLLNITADVLGRIDVAISSRSTLVQANILSDATPFAGATIGRMRGMSRFPSDVAASITLDTTGTTDIALSPVTVPDYGATSLPVGATIDLVRAILIPGNRKDTSTTDNYIDGTQYVQVKEHAAGSYVNAIKMVAGMYNIDVSEGTVVGCVPVFSNIDIKAQVSAVNKQYDFQWTDCKVKGNNMIIEDITSVLEFWWH